jgi:LmbE family N-acetylglucosaminyl deacetylase
MTQGKPFDQGLGAHHRHLYLSPHTDDVALSCGGLIFDQTRRGERVLVLTYFSGTPPAAEFSDFAQGQHAKWSLPPAEAMDRRRQEDRAALDMLGAESRYLDYLDCIYRLHPETGEPMYASEEGIFGDLDPAERDYHLALAKRTMDLIGPPRSDLTLYVPLAAGNHIDHQLLQRAAALVLKKEGYDLLYYEDYPYAQEPGEVQAALDRWPEPPPPHPHVIPITPAALEARIAAIAAYQSQIATLFGDLPAMEDQVRRYCTTLLDKARSDVPGQMTCAERYWHPV